jgi:hypothetical protein
MVPSVTTILQRFTTAWAAQLQPDAIYTAWQEAGYTSWRDRLLNPVTTVLQPGDVLVADRGLCAYAHLALLVPAGLHALLRV